MNKIYNTIIVLNCYNIITNSCSDSCDDDGGLSVVIFVMAVWKFYPICKGGSCEAIGWWVI